MIAASQSKHAAGSGSGLGVILLWSAAYIGARFALEALPAESGWRVPIALLPIPIFAVVLWNVARLIRSLDELQRRIHLEALAVAFPLTVMLLMVLGLLQLAVELNMDDWSYRHLWPIVACFYAGGYALARRRYA
jgi:hypothetical protein